MSDLISRQAAIDAIDHICPVDTEYDCTLLDRVDVRYVLSDLPSAQPEQRWIPCSERVPKEKQEVYVTVYFIEGDTGRAYGYMDGFGKWHLYSAVEGTLNSGYEVIAWIPLPTLYREENEE